MRFTHRGKAIATKVVGSNTLVYVDAEPPTEGLAGAACDFVLPDPAASEAMIACVLAVHEAALRLGREEGRRDLQHELRTSLDHLRELLGS